MPNLSNSPRMRSAPHSGFCVAISRISAPQSVGGRPGRRDRRRQKARNPARCQRSTVAGLMSKVASRQSGAMRAANTMVSRCHALHRTRPTILRSATISCCRRSTFSATSSTRGRTRSASSPDTNRRKSITSRVYPGHFGMGFVASTALLSGVTWSVPKASCLTPAYRHPHHDGGADGAWSRRGRRRRSCRGGSSRST